MYRNIAIEWDLISGEVSTHWGYTKLVAGKYSSTRNTWPSDYSFFFTDGEVKDHAAITDVTINLGKLERDLIRTLTGSSAWQKKRMRPQKKWHIGVRSRHLTKNITANHPIICISKDPNINIHKAHRKHLQRGRRIIIFYLPPHRQYASCLCIGLQPLDSCLLCTGYIFAKAR